MSVSSLVSEPASGEVVLTLNGARHAAPARSTVADLLASLELDARTVVIERNGTILRDRGSLAKIELSPGDTIEIVHFVGGG
jgi:thiamine biosynthesis protein ThiS